ncbi:MAG: hypothetical protein LBU14_01345 [Candidatus Peribacteria bacterium]|nr:hypothetical protein [Candidatus Peribacteria bacterium]
MSSSYLHHFKLFFITTQEYSSKAKSIFVHFQINKIGKLLSSQNACISLNFQISSIKLISKKYLAIAFVLKPDNKVISIFCFKKFKFMFLFFKK